MVNQYTIIVHNNTGSTQNYNLFSEKPNIAGVVKSAIWTNIYQTASGTPDGGIAEFDVWKSYNAIAGTWRGGEREGARVGVTQIKAATLGTQTDTGVEVPGTTLNLSVVNGTTPSFQKIPAAPSAWDNSFQINTGNDFTLESATENNFFIGLAASSDGDNITPLASFKPEPGNQYQIQPVNTFYVTYGSTFNVGQLMDVAKLPQTPLTIDFTIQPRKVIINHTASGKLVISAK